MYLKKHFFTFSIIFLLLITSSVSYYRFVIINDYLVSYESDCSPTTDSCYLGCEDEDDCKIKYPYKVIERHATDIFNLCGNNITGCNAAEFCTEEESECSVSFCDQETEPDDCYVE